MLDSQELPDCFYYPNQPTLVPPIASTPRHSLFLSNLDDQKFLRFTIKYLYLYSKSVSTKSLKFSLSRVLVDYYPLAGRLKTAGGEDHDHKLEVDCNGEGAVFAEAFMDITVQQMLQLSTRPNASFRKLLYRVAAPGFLAVPPVIVQVTNLRCGGMILCTAISHCLCDGIGTSQFLHAWAHLAKKPDLHLPVQPFHSRRLLRARDPPRLTHPLPGYKTSRTHLFHVDITKYLQSQPLVPAALNFTPSLILHLKRRCIPSLKSTDFEALASHTWRCWVRALDVPPSLNVKLLFSVNVRKKSKLPEGYYGNGFVLACAECAAKMLVTGNISSVVKLVQEAKEKVSDEYVRSVVDLLEDKTARTDLSSTLVISQWAKLGLEDLDFGGGKPMHMGSVTSDIYCLFLPVVGQWKGVNVLVSLPESVGANFLRYMTEFMEET